MTEIEISYVIKNDKLRLATLSAQISFYDSMTTSCTCTLIISLLRYHKLTNFQSCAIISDLMNNTTVVTVVNDNV